MKSRAILLSGLLLGSSLVSCAPHIATDSLEWQSYQIVSKNGLDKANVPIISIDQLTDKTPDTQYISFWRCATKAVSVHDVRRLGNDKAEKLCREAASYVNSPSMTEMAIGGVFVGVPLIYVMTFLIKKITGQ